MAALAEKVLDKAAIMAVLETVPDPEIPVLSITDLGIVRGIADDPPRVLVTPTYTGCPATERILALMVITILPSRRVLSVLASLNSSPVTFTGRPIEA